MSDARSPDFPYGLGFTSTNLNYLARGAALSGVGTDLSFWWDDFTQQSPQTAPNNYSSYATNGTHDAQIALMAGGILRESSSATAASQVGLNGFGTIVNDLKTKPWYIAFRMAVITAIDAQATAAIGWYNHAGTASVMGGVFGASSTAFYTVQFDGDRAGSFLTSAVAIDTNHHVFELYSRGDTTLRMRIDQGAEVTGTMANTVNSTHVFTATKNGTTAANRQMDIDWILAVGGRV